MRAVQIRAYGPAREVLEVAEAPSPEAPEPDEVIIAVEAASVNPVDCAIRTGYGKDFFRAKGRVGTAAFPVRLGRDAAGRVHAVGSAVSEFQVGEAVFTAPSGAAMAERIRVRASEVGRMPANLDPIRAASIPFVALTAWNALVNQAGLTAHNAARRRVIITRGAGGVGSFAIQLMKAWGAHVATTCSSSNVELVRGLGADVVVDLQSERISSRLRDYDVALDSSFDLEEELLGALKRGTGATYLTITSPKVRLIDEFGVEEGTRRAQELLEARQRSQRELGRHYDWAFMKPDGAALNVVTQLIEAGVIRPVIDRVYPLDEIVAAHERCESGRARGKIIIDFR
ncbi:MAG TPA: zinc-binding dehydrogenase [Steroidobacteraceae bacterium]|nr:zinc-binding dehydrogenase [Steroidobacteraceae bacterium]